MAASGFWHWLGITPGFAPSFMRCMYDCRCTRGYKIGHPCRDFRCPCNLQCWFKFAWTLPHHGHKRDACARIVSFLTRINHLLFQASAWNLPGSSFLIATLWAPANQLRQVLHYEVLNVVVLRWSGTLAPVLAKPKPRTCREGSWCGQNKAPIGAADIITPDKRGMKNASAFEPERSPGIGKAAKKSRDWF